VQGVGATARLEGPPGKDTKSQALRLSFETWPRDAPKVALGTPAMEPKSRAKGWQGGDITNIRAGFGERETPHLAPPSGVSQSPP